MEGEGGMRKNSRWDSFEEVFIALWGPAFFGWGLLGMGLPDGPILGKVGSFLVLGGICLSLFAVLAIGDILREN